MSPNEKVAKILASNRYLTLATSGWSGKSWASPLAYTIEPDFSLLFYSARNSIHSTNISKRSRVAGAIFDSTEPSDTVDGLQFLGRAAEFSGNSAELSAAMDRYFRQSFPDAAVRAKWVRPVSDFEGRAPQRFYRIELADLFTIDPASTKVDRRLRLDVRSVKTAYEALSR